MDIIKKVYSEPEKWRVSEYRFTHECGASVWIGNGMLFCRPIKGTCSILDGWRLWRAYKWWCKNAPIERLK